MNYIFSDLMCEISENTIKNNKKGDAGRINFRRNISKNIEFQNIVFDDGEKRHSIVYFTPQIWEINDADFVLLREKLAEDIRSMAVGLIGNENKNPSVLTVGLGNPFFSTDSLGPETVQNIKTASLGSKGANILSVIPNVKMNTGIESAEHVVALVRRVCPHLVIVIDSLAARSIDRLASTVQISNFGLAPGSGLGRMREKLDRETLGVPVISLGIPTVVNLSTVMNDYFNKIGNLKFNSHALDSLEKRKNFFITPKEIELVIKSGAFLLSEAVNSAFLGY